MDNNHTVVHGVFMRVFNIGVLLTGSSGVGKSSIALALLSRGHQLIADDAPEFYMDDAAGGVIGRSPASIRCLLELRGLGIINVVELFGTSSILEQQTLNFVIELQKTDVVPRIGEAPPIKFKPFLQKQHPLPHCAMYFNHHLYHPELMIEALVKQWEARLSDFTPLFLTHSSQNRV